jgi:HSP20 family protein
MKPAFWGVDRDLKDVLDTIDSVWNGVATTATSEFKETPEAFFLSMDLPGVNKSNLDIQVEGENLVINGTRKRVMPEGEPQEQKISRTFVLPKHVDVDKIQAHCEDGVLYLALPKLEQAKPKKIEINQGTEKFGWKKLLGN